jgi:hypothetical protein
MCRCRREQERSGPGSRLPRPFFLLALIHERRGRRILGSWLPASNTQNCGVRESELSSVALRVDLGNEDRRFASGEVRDVVGCRLSFRRGHVALQLLHVFEVPLEDAVVGWLATVWPSLAHSCAQMRATSSGIGLGGRRTISTLRPNTFSAQSLPRLWQPASSHR